MQIDRLILTVTGLLAAGAVCACGGSSGTGGASSSRTSEASSTTATHASSTTDGIASKSPTAIVDASVQALREVRSVHVAAALRRAGAPLAFNLYLASGKGARGWVATGANSFQLVVVDRDVYVNANATYLRSFTSDATARKLQGRWLLAGANGSVSTDRLTNLSELFNRLFAKHGRLIKGGMSVMDGRQVVALRDITHGGTLYVASTGTPYPIEVLKGGPSGGRAIFDHFNQPVSLTPPAHALNILKP